MSTLRVRLEARAPALHCRRAYEIAVSQDLFGAWITEMTYGRIGTFGRTKMRSFARIEDAVFAVDASLRRRATLPRRLGVAYQLRSVEFDPLWAHAGLSSRLAGFVETETNSEAGPDLP
jgi:predicted DNA-binding WGR domain protein